MIEKMKSLTLLLVIILLFGFLTKAKKSFDLSTASDHRSFIDSKSDDDNQGNGGGRVKNQLKLDSDKYRRISGHKTTIAILKRIIVRLLSWLSEYIAFYSFVIQWVYIKFSGRISDNYGQGKNYFQYT